MMTYDRSMNRGHTKVAAEAGHTICVSVQDGVYSCTYTWAAVTARDWRRECKRTYRIVMLV